VDQLLYDVTSGVVEEHAPQTGQTVSTVSLGLKSLYQPPVGTIQHNNNTENLTSAPRLGHAHFLFLPAFWEDIVGVDYCVF
jgi:hypothetical protein